MSADNKEADLIELIAKVISQMQAREKQLVKRLAEVTKERDEARASARQLQNELAELKGDYRT